MYKFTFKYFLPHNTITVEGKGKWAIGAFDNLYDNLRRQNLMIGRREELLEYALTAAVCHELPVEAPHEEFSIILEKLVD